MSQQFMDTDLQVLLDLRLKHPRNFLFRYLNINSLRNKVFDLRENVVTASRPIQTFFLEIVKKVTYTEFYDIQLVYEKT